MTADNKYTDRMDLMSRWMALALLFVSCTFTTLLLQDNITTGKQMRFFILALAFLLTSCSQLTARSRAYIEPESGDFARVRFSSNGLVHLIPNRNCVDWSAPGSGQLLSGADVVPTVAKLTGKTMGLKGDAQLGMAFTEVKVQAGKPLTIVFSSLTAGVASCDFSWAFVPKANEDYQVKVWHELAGGMCRFEPTSLTTPTQRVTGGRVETC